MESRNLVQTATSDQDRGTPSMCPTLASSWWGPSLQYRQWNVIILGIISLNCLGGQLLPGLLSSRVDTAVVKQSAGKCLSQQVFGTEKQMLHGRSEKRMAEPALGWGDGLLRPLPRPMCNTYPKNMHFAEAIITTISRSLGSLGFEWNRRSSHPYSQGPAPSFTTSGWVTELKTTESPTYVCSQSSF